MSDINLPDRDECFQMLREYHIPSHVLRHSLAVAKLAVFLGHRLAEKGIDINIDLIDRACLLHDIVRVCDFDRLDYTKFDQQVTAEDKRVWQRIRNMYGHMVHEDAAYEILKDDYPELATIIKKHRYMGLLDEDMKPKTWQEKLIYYSDCKVMHDRIVPVRQRLEEAHQRNVHLHGSEEKCRINTTKVDPLIYAMEKEIFAIVGLVPDEVDDKFIDNY